MAVAVVWRRVVSAMETEIIAWCVFVQIPISDTFVSNTTNVRGVLHLPFFSLLLTMLADCGILLRLFPL